ncbi:putative serine/threonine-protein kinase GCN2 [Folsomia candida]|uniref:Putative serine/threonine-protein kinase GCN2 n=1 Tax=Folsomia candida TaxID=158441 RepID=A0A226D1H4_FOLCA|nr:putative serine/threonine-protein kinase GCN2 [Folsomia candida]
MAASNTPERTNKFLWKLRKNLECIAFIGEGSYGQVYEVMDKNVTKAIKNVNEPQLCHKFAVKQISLDKLKRNLRQPMKDCMEPLMEEVSALIRLTHENVNRYFDSWVDSLHDEFKNRESSDGSTLYTSSTNESSTPGQHKVEDTTFKFFCLKLELCSTNLKEIIAKKWPTQECRYENRDMIEKQIFSQILDALCFIHGKNITHRDLKPENIFANFSSDRKVCIFKPETLAWRLSLMISNKIIVK